MVADNSLPDSPVVGRSYCPTCEPGTDSDVEIVSVTYCANHQPDRAGAEDEKMAETHLSGTAEAGGEGNRAVCDFFHRSKR